MLMLPPAEAGVSKAGEGLMLRGKTLRWQLFSVSIFPGLQTMLMLGTSKEMKKPMKIFPKLFHVNFKFHQPSIYLITVVSVDIKGKWCTWL